MNAKLLVMLAIVALLAQAPSPASGEHQDHGLPAAKGLIEDVRHATGDFRDVAAAVAAGYAPATGCVSGPQGGAMGVHFANADLIGDGQLDADRPELLMYEQRNGRMRLVGVEYLVIAEQWHANNAAPPVLRGQHFHYVGSPNRYGLPPFYELHVWAWLDNPNGRFADWNPRVSCSEYAPQSEE
jgi:hypothetical protein